LSQNWTCVILFTGGIRIMPEEEITYDIEVITHGQVTVWGCDDEECRLTAIAEALKSGDQQATITRVK
jgi:hypothetical protein